ncbi:hypothetical protein SteCoe_9421 [Stentor coeruleus]|uniref:Uncharacterized protein n=1 Tax=Stentor coeruleus TaxID=5963 RepID=A0A1R2CI58_9CILI|nr:hypothetical protein SteCoe_9421 [Stentor coeruleus]
MLGRFIGLLSVRGFSKRVVKEHLIDDKIQRMLHKPDPKEQTSEAETSESDFDDYRNKIMKKASLVEKNYRKKVNKDEDDVKEEEYWKVYREYEKTVKDYLETENIKTDPLNEQRMDKTRRLVRAVRLNNTFDFVREKNVDAVTNEYSNYSKFKQNYTYFRENNKNEMLDEGDFNLATKITEYTSKLAPMGDYEDTVERLVRAAELEGKHVSEELYNAYAREQESLHEQLSANEGEVIESGEYTFGRLSPHAREDIYDMYNNGFNVNDISLKYGILPSRVKAVIWCRRYFYDEVAPNLGRTIWRLGLEREISYAVRYPFIDYGLDLSVMAELEKGIGEIRFIKSAIDINPPPDVVKRVQEKIDKLRPPRVYTIPKGTVGKGPKTIQIKDIIIKRGNGKIDVSPMFKKVCYWGEKTPTTFPKKVRANLDKGPRIASYGYRISHKNTNTIRFYNKEYHSK